MRSGAFNYLFFDLFLSNTHERWSWARASPAVRCILSPHFLSKQRGRCWYGRLLVGGELSSKWRWQSLFGWKAPSGTFWLGFGLQPLPAILVRQPLSMEAFGIRIGWKEHPFVILLVSDLSSLSSRPIRQLYCGWSNPLQMHFLSQKQRDSFIISFPLSYELGRIQFSRLPPEKSTIVFIWKKHLEKPVWMKGDIPRQRSWKILLQIPLKQ